MNILKKIVIPRSAYGTLSVTALIDPWPWSLTFWLLNRFTSFSCDGLSSCQFGHFHSWVRSRHAIDRQTDRHRQSFYNAAPYGGRGIKILNRILFKHVNAGSCLKYSRQHLQIIIIFTQEGSIIHITMPPIRRDIMKWEPVFVYRNFIV